MSLTSTMLERLRRGLASWWDFKADRLGSKPRKRPGALHRVPLHHHRMYHYSVQLFSQIPKSNQSGVVSTGTSANDVKNHPGEPSEYLRQPDRGWTCKLLIGGTYDYCRGLKIPVCFLFRHVYFWWRSGWTLHVWPGRQVLLRLWNWTLTTFVTWPVKGRGLLITTTGCWPGWRIGSVAWDYISLICHIFSKLTWKLNFTHAWDDHMINICWRWKLSGSPRGTGRSLLETEVV